jgi:hypothetical protein
MHEHMELKRLLIGHVFRRKENQYEGDYSGGSAYWERQRALFLRENGTFHFEDQSFTSVSAGGMSAPSERRETVDGTWALTSEGGMLADAAGDFTLVLSSRGRIVHLWGIEFLRGVTYLDGQPWLRAPI